MTSFTLDWSALQIDGNNSLSNGDSDIDVAISTPQNICDDQWTVNNVGGEHDVLRGQGVTEPISVIINFDAAVENLNFELLDVDAGHWDDEITVIALNAAGHQVPVTFSHLAAHHEVGGADNNVLGSGGNVSPGVEGAGAPDSVTVDIAGPIVSLELIYANGDGSSYSGVVGVSDITFEATDTAGDGYVEGGSGDDIIDTAYLDDPEGDRIDNGDALLPGAAPQDDVVLAGSGDDTVRAGAGDDVIFGGAGADDLQGGTGDDVVYGDNPTHDGPLDFNALSAGDLVNEQFIESGVRISSLDEDHPVMVFDTDNPTGQDGDLATATNGNILILSEDRDSGDPDDNFNGGTMLFEFAGPSTVNSLDFIAAVKGAEIRLFDEDGNLISTITVPDGDNNTVFTQAINVAGVASMEVAFIGAGATGGVDNLDFTLTNTATDNDDVIDGGAGDDILFGQAGDDLIIGGGGNDTIDGGDGHDTIYGDGPITGTTLDFNALSAGDLVTDQFVDSGVRITSADPAHPVMVFDSANPTGDDFDLATPMNGNILILSEDGDSSDPDDNAGGGTFIFDFTGPATINSLDFIDQGAGTTIRLYDAGGHILNTINVPLGANNALITQAINTSGVSQMEVELSGSGAIDNLDFALESDPSGNDDTILGGDGKDIIFGQQGADNISGGAGDDTITGGAGADNLFGGAGSDTFLGGTAGDTVVGGEDDDDSDVDILDLTGSNVDFVSYDTPGGEAGTVTFLDGTTMTFSEIENVIPCFTPGTKIATPRGEKAAETLKIGDRVLTRDNGIQHITWAGHKVMSDGDLQLSPTLRPVLIRAGALGNGLPERNMLVSPNHRVLIVSEMAQLYFEESEVLIAAKHMTKMKGVATVKVPQITYVHFMCQNHEIVLSDGAWTETFQPGDYSLKGVDHEQRKELFELFPELATKEGLKQYRSARKSLKRHETSLLLK